MRLLALRLCAVLFSVVLFATSAPAATLYVSPSGQDENPGTIDQPLLTPGRALQLAGAGDTIYLRAGSYSITSSLSITQPGLTLASYPGERAAIVGGTTDTTTLTSIVIVYSSGVSLLELELQGGSYYGIKLDDANGPQSGIRVAGCFIHHTGRDGIKTQSSDNLVIEGNEIGFTGVRDATNAEGIDVMGSLGVTLRGNYVHDTATNGIFIKGGTVGGVVDGNRVERAGFSGILLGSESAAEFMRNGATYEAADSVARNNLVVGTQMSGLGSVAGDNVRFENNTVIDAAAGGQAGFRVVPNSYKIAARNVLFKNNVVALASGSTRPLVHLGDYSGTLYSDSNIWFSPKAAYQFWKESSHGSSSYWSSLEQWQAGMNADWQSLAVDPLLDPTTLYRPRGGSPAVDAGELLSEVTTDYFGTSRPQGAAHDIGAHETVVPTAPLGVPTGVTATAKTSRSIALSWTDHASSEEWFQVERSVDGVEFPVVLVVPANTTSYLDEALAASTRYYYRIKAVGGGAESAYSDVASATTPPDVPAAPSDLTAAALSTSQIELRWMDRSTNEDGFFIERSTNGTTFARLATLGANVTSFRDGGLRPNRTYYYRVAAFNAGGTSPSSNVAAAKTGK